MEFEKEDYKLFYCPCCERRRDVREFPKFFAGMFGKVCKSCMHYLSNFPDNHWKVKKFEGAGFQKESAAAIKSRQLMIERDQIIEDKRKKGQLI